MLENRCCAPAKYASRMLPMMKGSANFGHTAKRNATKPASINLPSAMSCLVTASVIFAISCSTLTFGLLQLVAQARVLHRQPVRLLCQLAKALHAHRACSVAATPLRRCHATLLA